MNPSPLRLFLITGYIVLGITACSSDQTAESTMRACFYEPGDLAVIQSQLRERSVPYSIDGDCLLANVEYDAELAAAQMASFGDVPPSGLNITPQDATETVERLAKAGFSSRIMIYRGREVVVWDEADALEAEQVLGLSPEMREGMRRMRQGQLPAPLP